MNLTKHDWMLISGSLYSRAAAMNLEAESDQDPRNRFLAQQQAQRLKFLASRLGTQGERAFEQYRATLEALFGLYRLVNDTGTDKVWESRKLWSKLWSDIKEVVDAATWPTGIDQQCRQDDRPPIASRTPLP